MTDAEAPIDLDVPGGPSPTARRGRQRWLWTGGAVLLAAAVALAVAAIGPTHVPQPPPPEPPPPTTGPLGWIEALVDGPARGGLGDDPAFARDLPVGITDLLHQTSYYPADLHAIHHRWYPDQEVRLLFADDIGTKRIVLLALRLPTAEANRDDATDPFTEDGPSIPGNRTKVLWFVAPRGASVSSLLSFFSPRPDPGVSVGSMAATPFVLAQMSYVTDFAKVTWLGLAPHGCTVSTASTTDLDTFVDEPTGSYIVRTTDTYRAEYWRVTCGGTVHEQGPGPASFHYPSGAEIQDAMAGDAGLSPAEAQAADVQSAVAGALVELYTRSSELTAAPRVIWAGAPQVDPGLGPVPQPYAVVVAAPAVRSGWFVGAWFGYLVDGYGAALGSALIHTDTDPAGQAVVLAAPLRANANPNLLILAPPEAHSVRLQTSDGTVVRAAPLTGGATVLELPIDAAHLRIQVYDETGAPVAAPVPVVTDQGPPDEVHDWSGPATIVG